MRCKKNVGSAKKELVSMILSKTQRKILNALKPYFPNYTGIKPILDAGLTETPEYLAEIKMLEQEGLIKCLFTVSSIYPPNISITATGKKELERTFFTNIQEDAHKDPFKYVVLIATIILVLFLIIRFGPPSSVSIGAFGWDVGPKENQTPTSYTYTNLTQNSFQANITNINQQNQVVQNMYQGCVNQSCQITVKDIIDNIYFLSSTNLWDGPLLNVSFTTPDGQTGHVSFSPSETRTYAACLKDNSTCVIFPEYRK